MGAPFPCPVQFTSCSVSPGLQFVRFGYHLPLFFPGAPRQCVSQSCVIVMKYLREMNLSGERYKGGFFVCFVFLLVCVFLAQEHPGSWEPRLPQSHTKQQSSHRFIGENRMMAASEWQERQQRVGPIRSLEHT